MKSLVVGGGRERNPFTVATGLRLVRACSPELEKFGLYVADLYEALIPEPNLKSQPFH